MLNRLRHWFSDTSSRKRAAEHWSRWQEDFDRQQPRYADWGEHPVILERLYEDHFGARDFTLLHFLRERYPQEQNSQALSLCCGDGGFENLLVSNGVFGQLRGIDIAPVRIEKAQREHCTPGKALQFSVEDVNAGHFGRNCLDVVLAKASLHHIEQLEAVFEGICRCLKPGGELLTIDFFGPTRLQWSDAQLDHANRLLAALPETLRTCRDGTVKNQIGRPTIDEMLRSDPSEAVRSAELEALLRQYFDIRVEFAIGGTLLNLILTTDIIDNFKPDDAEHVALLNQLYDSERALIQAGELSSDFKLIIATPR